MAGLKHSLPIPMENAVRDTINHFLASRNSEADLPDKADDPDEPEMESGLANRSWVPHAGEQDDGS